MAVIIVPHNQVDPATIARIDAWLKARGWSFSVATMEISGGGTYYTMQDSNLNEEVE